MYLLKKKKKTVGTHGVCVYVVSSYIPSNTMTGGIGPLPFSRTQYLTFVNFFSLSNN